MRKRIVVAMLAIFSLLFFSAQGSTVFAGDEAVVISHVQLGDVTSASNEFIELYNNTTNDIDVTNWCLYYASATATSIGSKLACFVPDVSNVYIFLPAHTTIFLISTNLSATQVGLGSDMNFSATLAGTAGHLRLLSLIGEVDKLGWGVTAVSPETTAMSAAPNGKVLQRKAIDTEALQDTNNNSIDFELATPRTQYNYGSLYEIQDLCTNMTGIQTELPSGYETDAEFNCEPIPVDVCLNIELIQETVPNGYGVDGDGSCVVDTCTNIDGLQTELPFGKELDTLTGQCVDIDVCKNFSGLQQIAPEGFVSNGNICELNTLPLQLSEMLPNPEGSDTDNEYIEIYNPNTVRVYLTYYTLRVDEIEFNFLAGEYIEPGEYKTIYGGVANFTLVNFGSAVTLKTVDSSYISSTAMYSDAQSGESWAYVAGTWQYTNQVTPGAANQALLVTQDEVEESDSTLKPCAPNQYRNPETNRCRLLVTAGSVLVACRDGQYRSETTNRCRNIASDANSLTPCDSDEYRSPETNRCRLLASAGTALAPCKEGQERNPDTNRCRNVAGTLQQAPFGIEVIADTSTATLSWWILGGVALLASAYGIWEWRFELKNAVKRLAGFIQITR